MAKLSTKVCRMCGREFETSARNALYCPDCKKPIRAEKEPPEKTQLHICDSPERINMCLTCTMAKCTGDCYKIRTTPRMKRGGWNALYHDKG